MKTKAVFYHAGCPVCLAAEDNVAQAIDLARYDLETVHLGNDRARLAAAEAAGVKSVPALVLDGQPFHINFGASLADLKRVGGQMNINWLMFRPAAFQRRGKAIARTRLIGIAIQPRVICPPSAS